MEKIIYEVPYAKIVFEPEYNLLSLYWDGMITSEQYREVFTKVKDFIVENKVKRFLAETTKQGPVSPTDRKWLETELVPQAVAGGLVYSATILGKDVFKQYYLTQIKDASEKAGINFRIFDNFEKGRQWILETDIS